MEQRATVFGGAADQYDRTRPGYPSELLDALITRTPTRVLDVGCGTGIASRLLAERGCDVLGVEPDARMAAVARNRGLEVEVARFEDWDVACRLFDVVFSAQAWHWIDPVAGAAIARKVLPHDGALAIIWNVPSHDPVVHAAFEPIYDRYRLPDGSRCSPPGALAEGSDRFIAGIATAGGYSTPTEQTQSWIQPYTAAQWIDLLPTHSDHRLLPDDDLRSLLDSTAAVIDELGGTIDVTYTTHLITAAAS